MNKIPELPRNAAGVADFSGYRLAFFGGFTYWPAYHGTTPARLAKRLGAEVVDQVDDRVDFLVLGHKRAKGRAAAEKQAKKMAREAEKQAKKSGEPAAKYPIIMAEEEFCRLTHREVSGKSFAFFGTFQYCPKSFDAGRPEILTKAAGGVVHEQLDESLDFLVVADDFSDEVAQITKQGQALQRAGSSVETLQEKEFLDLVRRESFAPGELDFTGFVSQLLGVVDLGRLTRALKMLKAESYQLFVEVEDDHLVGVVRSQTGGKTLYAPWLTSEGKYGCATANLYECMGLQGTPCKHLLVLLLGLARSHPGPTSQADPAQIDPAIIYNWIRRAAGKSPSKNKEDLVADTFLRYKSAEAGQVDWRPLETVPEDYYVF